MPKLMDMQDFEVGDRELNFRGNSHTAERLSSKIILLSILELLSHRSGNVFGRKKNGVERKDVLISHIHQEFLGAWDHYTAQATEEYLLTFHRRKGVPVVYSEGGSCFGGKELEATWPIA
ncbi:hypothetical protein U1Q18_038041 [Sarracenia purpurea var. burkii]